MAKLISCDGRTIQLEPKNNAFTTDEIQKHIGNGEIEYVAITMNRFLVRNKRESEMNIYANNIARNFFVTTKFYGNVIDMSAIESGITLLR